MYTYDPAQVSVLVLTPASAILAVSSEGERGDGPLGDSVVTGLAAGTFVTAQFTKPLSRTFDGVDGEVARSLTSSRRGSIVITLEAASPFNGMFSRMAEGDRATGLGLSQIAISDRAAQRPLVLGIGAWVRTIPKMTRGTELAPVAWTFDVGNLSITHRVSE
ncbi:MAG: DUF3277 family protein [Myxococcales bacterium FL481]|nr:MAG: DUF3277 family protein [Myxococcales bacterium FL481]